MKNILLKVILLMSLTGCATYKSKTVTNIEKYKIELPDELIKSSGGFYSGIGSSIEFIKATDNTLEFIAISDRGPNYPTRDKDDHIIMFHPEFSPTIVKISVNSQTNQAKVTDFLKMKYNFNYISGLNENNNSKDEVIYNRKLNVIKPKFGLDTESISILKNGNFVVGDEYYPSINIINHKNGEITQRLTPGNGIPEILKYRNFNRGFEALTVAPNGKIYAVLEGVLNIDTDTKQNAKLIRMIEVDLENSITKMYAYRFDYEEYKDSSKVKIGDIVAIDNFTFLIVEQGPTKDEQYRNIIYKINIKHATDIMNIKTITGKELEYADLDEFQNIKFIDKKFIFNPREYGWQNNKLEGLAKIDPYSIAITNDNDFAIVGYNLINSKCNAGKICTEAAPLTDAALEKTDLWIIRFKDSF